MLPASLSASHFRYGTMSWENHGDNGTILLHMQLGWRTAYGTEQAAWGYDFLLNVGDNSSQVNKMYRAMVIIDWGDGSDNESVLIKTISLDPSAGSTLTELGSFDSEWETGVYHTYTDNGTYEITWSDYARIAGIENSNLSQKKWRGETKVNVGGTFASNNSPVSAVPPTIQIQDNTIFEYQLVATDVDSDSVSFRWGTWQEFVDNQSGSAYSPPTGLELSPTGLVTWNVQDIGGQATDAGDNWSSLIMVEDLDSSSGDNKSHIQIDFVFKLTSADNDPPLISGIPNSTQTISIGNTKTFTITSTDDSGVAPTVSVLNPPSDNTSIWDNTTSISGSTTTFIISFSPDSSMDNKTYAVNIRSTDNESMTLDQSLGLRVTSVSNADPSVPTLLSPPDGSMVTNPVKFQWTESTDADNDSVSYTIYICTNSGFTGCSGTSVTAGVNFIPPFNQNFHDSLFSWPSPLQAAMIPQQISQDLAMIPKWLIMLSAFGLLSGLISFSLKNISHRKLVFMLILLIVILGLNINSCSSSDDTTAETATTPPSTTAADNTTDDGILSTTTTVTPATTGCTTCVNYTADDKTDKTTYYWKVVATDNRSASSQSDTWSFTVKL